MRCEIRRKLYTKSQFEPGPMAVRFRAQRRLKHVHPTNMITALRGLATGSWMGRVVNFCKVLKIEMSIDLRRSDVRMSK